MKSTSLLRNIFKCTLVSLCCVLMVFLWTNASADTRALQIHEIDKGRLCFVNNVDNRNHLTNKSDVKMIYFVTPTYPRPEQIAELTRLSHTLMHVPRLHWIVADDEDLCSETVHGVLRRSGLPFTHLSSPKPESFIGSIFPRGVSNRRASLLWLRENVHEGILYFGDDDNTVDLQLFDEIRNTKKVSMFPVGLIGGYGVSSPIVKDGKVVAFFDSWPAGRTFPVDMAGFAINIDLLKPTASMPYFAGYEEDRFLVSLGLKVEDIEPLAENCTKILVWHTRTVKNKKTIFRLNLEKLENLTKYQSFVKLLKEVSSLGMVGLDLRSGIKPLITKNHRTYETLQGLS